MNKWKVTNPNTTFVVVDEKFNHFIAECADVENARLIACAPLMLQTLKGLESFAQEMLDDIAADLQEGGYGLGVEKWAAVIQAIQKAEE